MFSLRYLPRFLGSVLVAAWQPLDLCSQGHKDHVSVWLRATNVVTGEEVKSPREFAKLSNYISRTLSSLNFWNNWKPNSEHLDPWVLTNVDAWPNQQENNLLSGFDPIPVGFKTGSERFLKSFTSKDKYMCVWYLWKTWFTFITFFTQRILIQ